MLIPKKCWRPMLIFLIFLGLLLKVQPAMGNSNSGLVQPAGENLDVSQLNRFIGMLDDDVKNYLPRLDPKSWGVAGPKWDFAGIGKGILHYFLRELVFNLRLAGELLLLATALAVLQNLNHAFEEETVTEIAFAVCFLVIMGIVLNSFRVTFFIAKDTITQMQDFMNATIPILFSLIVAGGGVATASIVHPILVVSIGMIGGVVVNLIFPLLLFGGVLGLVDQLINGFNLDKLANLFKSAALGLLGLAMAIFIGIITIRGFAASVADTMALRTAKYVTNTFLPVVGGAISDTMEMAAGCSLILKSGLGIYGLGLILLILAFPLAKILAVVAIYQLTGAVIQPLGNERLSDALQCVGTTFLTIFGALVVVGLMFFISLAILVGAANFGIR